MTYGKHLVSTNGNDHLNAYFRHFTGHLTCSYNFCGYKRLRKLKTANFYTYVFETKTPKFGDAEIFHFMVILYKKNSIKWSIYHKSLLAQTQVYILALRECSGSVVDCLTQNRGATGSSLTGVTALCPEQDTFILG